jgi:16S rRNA C1402 N4-methylase RsmH
MDCFINISLGIDLDENLIEIAKEKNKNNALFGFSTDFFSNFQKYQPSSYFEYFSGRKVFDVIFADLGYNM